MYRPPPPRFPSHPLPSSHPFRSTYGPPNPNRPSQAYVCRRCEARGLHFLKDCPCLSEGEKKVRRERWESEKRLPDLPYPYHKGGGGPYGQGFEKNGAGGGGGGHAGGFARGNNGYQQRSYDAQGGGGGTGPSHHRNLSSSSNAPNSNLITTNSNPYRTDSRRPSDAAPPPFHFIPADTWTPSHDENDYELGQARRSRDQRQQEERRAKRDREAERTRDERTPSSPSKRALRKEKRRERYEEAEEEREREKERGRKRERRDSGFHEEESPSSRRRSRESSAAAAAREPSRDQGRRPLNQVRGRRDSASNANPERSPKKNRRPRSSRPSPAPHQQQHQRQQQPSAYGPPPPPPPPPSPPRPLLSRIDRAEELIQDESQVEKHAEESSDAVGAYTGPGWNVGFSHYNEKIEVRRRTGSETNGGRMFRVPSDGDRSLPYEMINKVDPMLNLHHQRENDLQHFPSWPVTPFNGANIPYHPWNISPPGQDFQPNPYGMHHTSPHKTWTRTTDQGYEVEYPNGKSTCIASASRGPLPPLEQGRLISKRDSYFPTYDDEDAEGEDEPEEGEVRSSRAQSEVGSSVSHHQRDSAPSEEEEEESRPEEPPGREDWETLSICRDDPVEDRSDEPQVDDDDGLGERGRDDSRSDRSMASHSPSPRRNRDRSQSSLGGRSPSNALGITLRPRSTLPSVGRVEPPSQLGHEPPPSARHSSRLREDLPPISPKTLATLLPALVPVRRLMLEINRPRRLPSSRALGAFNSSDSLQPGTATPVLSPRIHSCTIAGQGFKATLPDEEGKRRLLFVAGTGAGSSFWEGGDFGPGAREEDEEDGIKMERSEDGEVVEDVKGKGRETKSKNGIGATSSSATIVPQQSTPLLSHPYRHSPYPSGPANFNPAFGGGSGPTEAASKSRGGSSRWPARSNGPPPPSSQPQPRRNQNQPQTPTNPTSYLYHHRPPPPPPSTSTNEGAGGGLPPSSDLDSSHTQELRARVVLSLQRQRDSPTKSQPPPKAKPSIIIHTTSLVPANSSLGLYDASSISPPTAPTPAPAVDLEFAPPTASTSSTTLPTLPKAVYLEILKHMGDESDPQQSVREACEEWNETVEGSRKVAVDSAPSEPENSVSQDSEEGEIDGMEMGMEGVVELGRAEGGGEVGEEPLNKSRFKASFRSITSSDPMLHAELPEEVVEMEEVEG